MRLTLPALLIAGLVPAPASAGPGPTDDAGSAGLAAVYLVGIEADFDRAGPGAGVDVKEVRVALQSAGGPGGPDAGLDYQYTRYEFDGIRGRNRDLHWIQLPVGLRATLGGWRLDGFVAPGVWTSSNVLKDPFDELSGDDLGVIGRISAVRDAATRWGWLAGVGYDRSFGEPRWYPVAGALWRPRADLELRLAWPDSAVRFRPGDRQQFMLRVFPAGNQWHVVSEELDDDFDFETEAWRAQAWWSLRLGRRTWLDLSAGLEFAREFRFVDDTGDPVDSAADDQVFLAVGARFGAARLPAGQQTTR